jgi:hypothetical protein
MSFVNLRETSTSDNSDLIRNKAIFIGIYYQYIDSIYKYNDSCQVVFVVNYLVRIRMYKIKILLALGNTFRTYSWLKEYEPIEISVSYLQKFAFIN